MMLKRKTPLARGTSELKRTPLARGDSQIKRPEQAKEPKRRARKCVTCRTPFEPRSMTHKACKPECAAAHVEAEKARQIKRERQEGLAKLKRRADYFKEAQAALNKWIRLVRDAGKPCISCGRFHQGQNHAGHYLARGSHPHLALVETNLALQCMPCNVHLSGNQLAFRRGLIERIGLEAVEALESDTAPRKYSIDELVAIKVHYTAEVRKALKATA
jgi:hypothetical protein